MTRRPDNLKVVQALRALGHFANTHTPHYIASPSMEPVEEDADEFNSDLMLLARHVDTVIEAYGEYLQSHGILSKGDVDDCFRRQVEDVLQGNATFLVTSGVSDRIEGLADQSADHRRELARGDV